MATTQGPLFFILTYQQVKVLTYSEKYLNFYEMSWHKMHHSQTICPNDYHLPWKCKIPEDQKVQVGNLDPSSLFF